MRLRSVLALSTALVFLATGCAPEPVPTPKPKPSSSASVTPSPTPDPIIEPEAAFDVTCDEVAAELITLAGEPSTPVEPALSLIATMGWLPGPPQHMFQRAGGIACSAGQDADRRWEVTIVPDATTVAAGASERQGFWGDQSRCENGGCFFEILDGEVLLSASIHEPGVTESDTQRFEDAMRRLAAKAAATLREVDYVDSDLVGLPCERFTSEQELTALVGEEVLLFSDYGGWSIPSEVYQYVNGSRICIYVSAEGDMGNMRSYLMITALPAGAWAFERQDGSSAEVQGADAAKSSVGEHGESILDVQLGRDWVRFTTFDNGDGAGDPIPFAEKIVRNLTVGPTAPE